VERDQTSTGNPKLPERSAVVRRASDWGGVEGGTHVRSIDTTIQNPKPSR
jgi:hypothetical protein